MPTTGLTSHDGKSQGLLCVQCKLVDRRLNLGIQLSPAWLTRLRAGRTDVQKPGVSRHQKSRGDRNIEIVAQRQRREIMGTVNGVNQSVLHNPSKGYGNDVTASPASQDIITMTPGAREWEYYERGPQQMVVEVGGAGVLVRRSVCFICRSEHHHSMRGLYIVAGQRECVCVDS